ncbi:unnamed protein product, partial [Mesorhabditis belari]|uniref:Nucleoside diphosphate kinase-like domain-containing protein n=1 Tax=Mesorhabditis belari TaxID=2138241 RepID=A0AAF3F8U4_9BILA
MHRGRFYYGRLVRHISSGPVVALKVIGDARAVLGSSKLFPLAHEKDLTLRQRFSISDVRNVAHNSDPENAQKELEMVEPLEEMKDFSQVEHSLRELYRR